CYRSRILLPRRAAPAPSRRLCILLSVLFFFNDPAPPEISTLSLHDALPIWQSDVRPCRRGWEGRAKVGGRQAACARESDGIVLRSEEHTSELQSLTNLVCRLLLEKKKQKQHRQQHRCTERECYCGREHSWLA